MKGIAADLTAITMNNGTDSKGSGHMNLKIPYLKITARLARYLGTKNLNSSRRQNGERQLRVGVQRVLAGPSKIFHEVQFE